MPAMVRLNVGVLGLSHDHVWGNLAALRAGDQGRLVAAAEPDRELRERLRALDGGVAVHESFDALLERRDLDAAFVFSDNRASAELAARALGRGLPVMLEKPMAADLPGARALLAAARAANALLMINWPTAWRSALRHGLTLAGDGAVGAPIQLSHRGGHAGRGRPRVGDVGVGGARPAAGPPAGGGGGGRPPRRGPRAARPRR